MNKRRWNLQNTQDYLLVCLNLRGGDYANLPLAAQTALRWYVHLHNHRGIQGMPFFLILDLGHLLHWGRTFPFRCLSRNWMPTDLAMAYENLVLNQLLDQPSFLEAVDIIEEGHEEQLVPRTLEIILRPFLVDRRLSSPLPDLDASVLRELYFPDRLQLEERMDRFRRQGGVWELYAQALQEFIARFQTFPREELLSEADLWELRHAEAFPSPSTRKMGRQINQVIDFLPPYQGEPLPLRKEREEEVTTLTDEGHYPQGGITQISRRGSFENLVPSELIYLPDRPGEVDLFDVRYVESELLFYQRESLEVRRRRRSVHLVLSHFERFSNHLVFAPRETPLEKESRVYKFSILWTGFTLSLIRDLMKIFSRDAGRFHLYFLCPTSPPEHQIAGAVLHRERERGEFAVHVSPRLDWEDLEDESRLVHCIWFSLKREEFDELPSFPFHQFSLENWLDDESGEIWAELDQLKKSIISRVVAGVG